MHVKYRIDGVLQPAMRPIAKQFHSSIISRIKVMAELDIAEKRVPQDGRFKLRMPGKTIDFRVSIMPSVHGEDAVIRILDKESISEQFTELRLDILGFPEAELKRFRKYIAEPYGMVLVTGPTGSGKTTTLYAALSEIKSVEDKIITIEDPVEYQLRGITQIPINEKKGLTFARGLRSILRHDPDKIMVGEIRDDETAQIAINSALTGHLVFTTVHANNVLDVLGRFLNMGVEAYQFVSALNCVLAQRLVRNICHHCKRPAKVIARAARGVGARSGARAHAHVLRRHRLHRVRRHRLQGPDGDLRAARPHRPHPRDDSREAADLGDQEGGARRRHAVPARVGGRAGDAGHDDAARDQQGDVRRMSLLASLRETRGPPVAVEIAADRVSAASLEWRGGQPVVAAHAIEPLPPGALVPSLTAPNIVDRAAVAARARPRARAGRAPAAHRRWSFPIVVAQGVAGAVRAGAAASAPISISWSAGRCGRPRRSRSRRRRSRYVPGRSAPTTARSSSCRWRGATSSQEYEAAVRRGRRARRHRRSRDVQRDQRGARRGSAAAGRRLAARERRAPTTRRSRSCADRT